MVHSGTASSCRPSDWWTLTALKVIEFRVHECIYFIKIKWAEVDTAHESSSWSRCNSSCPLPHVLTVSLLRSSQVFAFVFHQPAWQRYMYVYQFCTVSTNFAHFTFLEIKARCPPWRRFKRCTLHFSNCIYVSILCGVKVFTVCSPVLYNDEEITFYIVSCILITQNYYFIKTIIILSPQ